jgi:hypothetical protein
MTEILTSEGEFMSGPEIKKGHEAPANPTGQSSRRSDSITKSSPKLFQKLRDLEANATSGEWHIGHVSEINGSAEIESADLMYVATVGYGLMHRQDQAFICEMRNALPKLLKVIDLYEEALEDGVNWRNGHSAHCESACKESLTKAREIANG